MEVVLTMEVEIQITTLTGKKIDMKSGEAATLAELKIKLQDREGIPPGQQSWLFPVPAGTANAKSVMKHRRIARTLSQLDPALRKSFMDKPLLDFMDKATLGEVKATQCSEDGVVRAFLVLVLRPVDNVVFVKQPNGKTLTVDVDFSAMTGAELHGKVLEKWAEEPLVKSTTADTEEMMLVMRLDGTCKRLPQDKVLWDCGLRPEETLHFLRRPDWYPKMGAQIEQVELEAKEDELRLFIIKGNSLPEQERACCALQ